MSSSMKCDLESGRHTLEAMKHSIMYDFCQFALGCFKRFILATLANCLYPCSAEMDLLWQRGDNLFRGNAGHYTADDLPAPKEISTIVIMNG